MKELKEVLNTEKSTISSLLERSEEIQSKCTDYLIREANITKIMLNEEAGLSFMCEDKVHRLDMTHHSFSQLCGKLGVPIRYLEKCIENGRISLAQQNINSWFDNYNKDLLIRGYGDTARGILSSKYSVCDTPEILGVLEDVVDLSKYDIKGSFLNEERLHLRLVGKEMLPIDGEDLFAGLFIDSSDVGRNILSVKFGIYKQVCTNGLVIARAGGVLFEQKHIGITSDEFHSGFVKSLSNVDLLTENAVEWVRRAQHRENHWSAVSEYEDDINEFVAYIRQQTALSEESSRKVISLMQNKYTDDRWGLINGITEVAQDYTLEKRLELERIAGNLLVA